MALVSKTSDELIVLFDTNVQNKTKEIYRAIPGSLIKYLEKREVVKKIRFRQNFSASQVRMGTKKKVNFIDFEEALRKTIHERFIDQKVNELRAEDLSQEISRRYQAENPSRPDKGQSVSTIIKFNEACQKKDGDFWTNVNAHVYIYIEEECENNWFAEDKRKFNYDMDIELNGIAVNKDKAIKFSQMVSENSVENAVHFIGKNYALTWDEV